MTRDLTKITTPFGLLDEATKGALKSHKDSVGAVEMLTSLGWRLLNGSWLFMPHFTYRARLEPKREAVEILGSMKTGWWHFGSDAIRPMSVK